jgi:NTP pyrophosphatase (non-canonical NTP hydrolase)
MKGGEDMSRDSYQAMLAAVQAFHDKHELRSKGGEELTHRLALMLEELGEMAACVTKGRAREQLAEESADLLILLLGTAISANFDLNAAFWRKMEKLQTRAGRMVGRHIRVSEFSGD